MRQSDYQRYLEKIAVSLCGSTALFIFSDSAGVGTFSSVAGVVIGTWLYDNIPELSNRAKQIGENLRVQRLLNRKLESDLNQCFLMQKEAYHGAINGFATRFADVGLIKNINTDPRLTPCSDWEFPRGRLDESATRNLVRRLGRRKHLWVSVKCVNSGAVVVLKNLQSRLLEFGGPNLHIECSYASGREQMIDVQEKDRKYDFVILPLDPLVVMDEERKADYRLVTPVNQANQYLYYNTRAEKTKGTAVWLYSQSSASMQFQWGKAIPRRSGAEEFQSLGGLPDLVNTIPGGDYALIWDPITALFERQTNYRRQEGSHYAIYYCLFARKSWFQKNRRTQRQAFQRLFADAWLHSLENRRHCLRLLKSDEAFLKNFARGSGLTWTPRESLWKIVYHC